MRRTPAINAIVTLFENLLFVVFVCIFIPLMLPYSRIRLFCKKVFHLRPTILWAPIPNINISENRLADRAVGLKSDCLVYTPYHITQTDLFDYHMERWHSNIAFYHIIPRLLPYAVMFWAALRYDLFNFYYSGGFLYEKPQWIIMAEFVLWKVLGKRTVVSPYGGDVRTEVITRQLGKYHYYIDFSHQEVLDQVGPDAIIERRVKFIIKYCDAAVSGYDMIDYTPGSRNNIFFWAVDTNRLKPIERPPHERVVIVHAPNNPRWKGTSFLLPAIERLQREGYPIELVMVQKMTNDQARKQYERADIFAEQFIGGTHGFTAIEAMALGKPVITYLRRHEGFPGWIENPMVNANPDNLYDVLRRLVSDKRLRQEIGQRSRHYVEEVYSLQKVGERFQQLYNDIW